MKRIHLLAHDGPPAALAPLFEAAGREGLRVGWLDLREVEAPPELETAVSGGAFRAVAVGTGRVVAMKAPAGPPVLRDLLREHFLGCALVVVRPGEGTASELADVPRLDAGAGGYRVTPPGGAPRELSAETLAARLRRPRPFE